MQRQEGKHDVLNHKANRVIQDLDEDSLRTRSQFTAECTMEPGNNTNRINRGSDAIAVCASMYIQ